MDIKQRIDEYMKKYEEKSSQTNEAKTKQLEPLFTDKNEAKRSVEYLEENIEAPYVKGSISALGGRMAVFLKISLDEKSQGNNGIFENSRHFTMEIEPDPTKNNLDQIQKDHNLGKKFRKQKGKTLKEIANKINKYIQSVS